MELADGADEPARGYPGLRDPAAPAPKAILFDRDGTLVVDVPYNRLPALVRPLHGVAGVLAALRTAAVPIGVVTNQSGVARGLLSVADVLAVHRRVDDLLGPFDVWEFCPHGPDDGCSCRKPAPGMILRACRKLGLEPGEIAVIGDIGADVEAATAAGATGVLVPTPVTRAQEVAAAELVAPSLEAAVSALMGWEAGQLPLTYSLPEHVETPGAPRGMSQ
ncbi:HAD family hydrolase [Paenarthrobacter sp. Z7-10]|uniref:D-glycero-alpha-D-manno-heptose-1,7-bisphosphate 7-phosphatase n=1 Tax=Paenarthrobacter sp. Z7-10 TaxID=2787635 RepID=UPI0022A9BB6F|nr:HAD family hydrolase [Paenarthrobacter sp. Z7-10]MCZ2403140.1 HAD family hydrolase [Paenarthrobacter sp. Z7-10]